MSIREILKDLYIEAQWKTMRDKQPALFRDEDIAKTYQAILAEFERMLPKEKLLLGLAMSSYETEQGIGYNQAIQDMKAKLHENL